MTAEEFVDVKLTDTGSAAAGKGADACVRVQGANYEYRFVPGKPLRVPAAEYRSRLAETRLDGKLLFEIDEPAKAGK